MSILSVNMDVSRHTAQHPRLREQMISHAAAVWSCYAHSTIKLAVSPYRFIVCPPSILLNFKTIGFPPVLNLDVLFLIPYRFRKITHFEINLYGYMEVHLK